jgi:hypothetical protein
LEFEILSKTMSKTFLKILIITAVMSLTAINSASAGWTEGEHNSAIDFNGTSTYVDGFGAIGNIKTVSFWMKADDITDRKIMDFDGTDQIEIDGSSNILATSFPGAVAIYIDGVNKTASPTIDTNWHHIAITTDTNVNASAVVIGKVGASFFDGKLDDVKIYAYARSAPEVLLDYNAGMATHLGPSGKTCSQDPASCMDYGLTGSWNMDEGAGTMAYDSSDNSNDGTLTGGPVWTADSSPLAGGGGSLKFDGVDDYVSVDNDASLKPTSAIAISAWIKCDNPSSGTFRYIIDQDSPNYSGKGYSLYFSTNNSLYFTTRSTAANVSSILGTVDGNWHFLVATWDGTNQKVYLNGVLKDTDPRTSNIEYRTDNYPFTVGTKSQSSDFYFNGSIDEVRIYNRAVSAEEVRYHYNKGGPVAEWKFDEGSGQTAFDESFNNNDGTLGGTSAVEASDPTWVEGKYGGALSFDGSNDYVDCGSGGSLNDITIKTIGVWIYPVGWGESGYGRIVNKTNVLSENGFIVYLNDDYNNVWFWQDFSTAVGKWKTPDNSIVLNNWYHVVVVYDSSSVANNAKIYLNGVSQNITRMDPEGTVVSDATSNINIGARASTNRFFNGSIDSVRIYNYARTAEQIQIDYNAGVGTHFR